MTRSSPPTLLRGYSDRFSDFARRPIGRRGPDRTPEFEQALLDLALQVGENDAAVRRDALTGLAPLGIELDEHLNASPVRGARVISAQKSPTVLVTPTNEELGIARACLDVIAP